MKWATLFIIVLNCIASAFAQRGVCKGDSIPPNKVIVREYVSEQCDPTANGDIADPDAPNAYELATARDGMSVCQPIAPAGFFVCKKNQRSDDCAGHETYLLAAPKNCVLTNPRLEGLDLTSICPDRHNQDGTVAVPDGWIMVGTIHSAFCGLPGDENAWVIRRVQDPNLVLPASRPSPAGRRVPAASAASTIDLKTNPPWKCKTSPIPPLAAVIGRFETPNCPSVAPKSALNGELIVFVDPMGRKGWYDVCIDSPIPASYVKVTDVPRGPVPVHHSSGGKRRPSPKIDLSAYPVHTFHKAECEGAGANAITIRYSFPPTH